MGQYWKIVNVDKCEQIWNRRRHLKMIEMLSARTAAELLEVLKVPSLLKPRILHSRLAVAKDRQNRTLACEAWLVRC